MLDGDNSIEEVKGTQDLECQDKTQFWVRQEGKMRKGNHEDSKEVSGLKGKGARRMQSHSPRLFL